MTQVYTTLISGPDDVPGALAYVVYKRMKIEMARALSCDLFTPT